MGRVISDLLGTWRNSLRIRRGVLDASALTGERTFQLPDYDAGFQEDTVDADPFKAMITGAFGHGCTPSNPPPLLANLDAADTPSGKYIARAASGTTGTFPPIAGGFNVGVVDILRLDTSGTLCVQVFRGPASGLSGGNPLTYHRSIHSVLGASTWRVVWDGQNFDPTTKADLAGATFIGPISAAHNSKIVGAASGASNVALLGFYEGDATTRVGVVGDSGSGHSHFTVQADLANLVLAAPNGSVVIDGVAVDNTDSGWISLTLTNGWSANSTFGTPAYRRIGRLIFLRGVIQASSSNNNKIAFTLPSGYRPATQWFLSVSGGAFLANDGVLSIATNGQATANDISVPATCNINLSGCVLVAA